MSLAPPTAHSAVRPGHAALIDARALDDRIEAAARDPALAPAARRQTVVTLLREADAAGFAEARARCEQGAPGLGVAQALCGLKDMLIRAAYDYVIRHEVPGLSGQARPAVAAQGGYGRGLIAPYSDLDLLFLMPAQGGADGAEKTTEALLYLLWDAGLKVSHAVRTVAEAIAAARDDHTIATALLELRPLAGDDAPVETLRARFWAEVAEGTGGAFVAAKLAERDARHKRAGNSRYLVEPNLKDGKGGLRDLHTLYWIAKYVYRVEADNDLVDRGLLEPQDFTAFKRAAAFLWDVRVRLHFLAGRAEERLSFDMQPRLAAAMGFAAGGFGEEDTRAGNRAVEAFMKTYFRTAKDVGGLTRIICADLELANQKSRPASGVGVADGPLEDAHGFAVERGRLTVMDENAFARDPVNLIRIFHIADRRQLFIHPHALTLITRALHLIDDDLRADEEANRLFLDILTSPRHPDAVLRRMNEAGVLGAFMPDFGRIVAQMQFNMYHHFTVDEHLIRAIGQASRIEKGVFDEADPLTGRVAKTLANRRVLYVALFLHDIAKGRGGDHSDIGAEIARAFCPRMGMSAAETETVEWLVRHHLALSDTAQRRDIADPRTVRDFADLVQSPERLKLLLVLTAADIRAVGPGVWNAWKGKLIGDLYEETEAVLLGEGRSPRRAARVAAAREALAAALAGWPAADRDAALGRFNAAYWLGFDTRAHQRHAEMGRRVLAAPPGTVEIAADPDPALAVTALTVATRDRKGLVALITGAIAAAGAAIVTARIFTASDGLALDVFTLQEIHADGRRHAFDNPRRLDRVRELIESALRGESDPSALIERRPRTARARAFTVAPEVIIDNSASETSTVIEIAARDRPGLLHDLARAIRDLDLSLASAAIATFGERAVDVFYVKDRYGLKITHPRRLRTVTEALEAVVAGEGG
jgi:[protein-PII] uridylyltransferase